MANRHADDDAVHNYAAVNKHFQESENVPFEMIFVFFSIICTYKMYCI